MLHMYYVCKSKIIFKITWTRGYYISNNFKFYGYHMLVDNVSKNIVCENFKYMDKKVVTYSNLCVGKIIVKKHQHAINT